MFWNPDSAQQEARFPSGNPRSSRGQYVGASSQHDIAMVRNLRTGCLTPQFHVVFVDWFETVHAGQEAQPDNWETMCACQRWEIVFNEETPPQLKDKWLHCSTPFSAAILEYRLVLKEMSHGTHKCPTGLRMSRDSRSPNDSLTSGPSIEITTTPAPYTPNTHGPITLVINQGASPITLVINPRRQPITNSYIR